jgi:hypothetical protein
MLPRSFTSPKLAHKSALLLFYCSIHEILSIYHAGSWVSAAVSTLPHPRDLQHLSYWLINLSCCPYTSPSLYGPVHEIHSVYHAGSWLSAARRYMALSTRFPASVMLAHESLLLSLHCSNPKIHSICHTGSWISAASVILPCPWDSQHLSC